jgi:hypothetical protein
MGEKMTINTGDVKIGLVLGLAFAIVIISAIVTICKRRKYCQVGEEEEEELRETTQESV